MSDYHNLGRARPLAGMPFRTGDTVARNATERAEVTYVSADYDYAELRYPEGFTFRTRKSEWRAVRYTVLINATQFVPRAHRATFAEAIAVARNFTNDLTNRARIVERERAYPFTHIRAWNGIGEPITLTDAAGA